MKMPRKGRGRVYDKIILSIFQQHKIRRLRFNEMLGYLREVKPSATDVTLKKNLDYLMKKKLVFKLHGKYCLIDWAGTIATNEFLNLLYDLRDRYPQGGKKWIVEVCIIYRFLKGIDQLKILSEKEREIGEKAFKLGLLNDEGIKKMRMEAENKIEQETINCKN